LVACGGNEFTVASSDGGGPTTDSGLTNDAGDAAAVLAFCSTIDAGFCSDFDEAPLPERWANLNQTGGATGVENSDASVSPPNSFLASAPAFVVGDGGTTPAARAVLSSPGLPKGQSHIAFDMRIDELSFPPTTAASTAAVVVAAYTQGTDYAVALEFHPGASGAPFTAALLELTTTLGNTTAKVDELPGIFTQVGVWYSVSIDFAIDTSDAGFVPASITATVGNVTNSKALLLMAPLDSIGGARTFSVGVQSTPPTGAAVVRFDNVTYSH
jgi:hypothetical protein